MITYGMDKSLKNFGVVDFKVSYLDGKVTIFFKHAEGSDRITPTVMIRNNDEDPASFISCSDLPKSFIPSIIRESEVYTFEDNGGFISKYLTVTNSSSCSKLMKIYLGNVVIQFTEKFDDDTASITSIKVELTSDIDKVSQFFFNFGKQEKCINSLIHEIGKDFDLIRLLLGLEKIGNAI